MGNGERKKRKNGYVSKGRKIRGGDGGGNKRYKTTEMKMLRRNTEAELGQA